MGLDNIPKHYPCMTNGTAVRVPRLGKDDQQLLEEDGTVMMVTDCQATQFHGGCPYVSELDKQDKTLLGNPVHGMFGTDCWYRGKYGNYLLDALGYDTDELSFYGDNEDGTEKSKASCLTLADCIDASIDEWQEEGGDMLRLNGEDITPDLRYASWYLKWAAEFTDGLVCWY
jgi:hypothetical protein